MRTYKILGILVSVILFAACKDAKVMITKKSSRSSSNPPGFEVNGQQNLTPMTGSGITLKGRVEMNPVVTSPSSALTAGGITMRAGVVK